MSSTDKAEKIEGNDIPVATMIQTEAIAWPEDFWVAQQRERLLVVLRVVADEVGSPTYTIDLANGLLALLSAGATGLYHLTGAGSCSRYELALETLHLAGFAVPGDLMVEPVMSASFPTRAMRPLRSMLDCGKAAGLGVRLPEWQDGLARFLGELQGDKEVAWCAPTSS